MAVTCVMARTQRGLLSFHCVCPHPHSEYNVTPYGTDLTGKENCDARSVSKNRVLAEDTSIFSAQPCQEA
jgi:hypothetical protein